MIHIFFYSNTVFTWSSKKQHIITFSAYEAEYVATLLGVCRPLVDKFTQ